MRGYGLGRHLWTLNEEQVIVFNKVNIFQRRYSGFTAVLMVRPVLVHRRHPSVYHSLLDEKLTPDSFLSYLRHPDLSPCHSDIGSRYDAVVDWYHPRIQFDLHTCSAQLASQFTGPLW